MTKTTNYQLNQWAKSDRIRMEDFNADNAKVDAALKGQAEALAAETVAREAADTALSERITEVQNKSSLTVIKELHVDVRTENFSFSVADVNWGAYEYVFVECDCPQNANYHLVGNSTYYIQSFAIQNSENPHPRVTLPVGKMPNRLVVKGLTYDQLQTMMYKNCWLEVGSTIRLLGIA